MVNISIDRINQVAPYKVSADKNALSVKIITDYDVTYLVGFEYTDILSRTDTYEFAITNLSNKKSPND